MTTPPMPEKAKEPSEEAMKAAKAIDDASRNCVLPSRAEIAAIIDRSHAALRERYEEMERDEGRMNKNEVECLKVLANSCKRNDHGVIVQPDKVLRLLKMLEEMEDELTTAELVRRDENGELYWTDCGDPVGTLK